MRAGRGRDCTTARDLRMLMHACSHASNVIIIALRACLSAHAGPIRMGTMPPPALLPAIQLMGRQPADPQPARAVITPAPPQLTPLPAARTAIPQLHPQPAPQSALQPSPQQAAALLTATATPATSSQVLVPAGLYLGHGVPQRLLTKILNLEFIEM
jgi:hypothetical protein